MKNKYSKQDIILHAVKITDYSAYNQLISWAEKAVLLNKRHDEKQQILKQKGRDLFKKLSLNRDYRKNLIKTKKLARELSLRD